MLSDMDYKEKLQEAKRLYESATADQKYVLESLFTELKKSEDEKIRDEICIYIGAKEDISLDVHNRWLSWLEKQGEQKSQRMISAEAKEAMYNKPADKIEPKFNVGDWVVYYRNDSSREVLQVYDIRDSRYYFTDNVHFSWSVKECDEKSHLWTIQDAKDGDVLVASDDSVFIFARVDGYACIHHIALANDGELKINSRLIHAWESVKGVKPATKEQRDLLFQKMHEFGYEWDAEKKGLRKIEQKPAIIDIDEMVNDYANNDEPGNQEFGKPVPCMIRAYRQGLNDAIRKVAERIKGVINSNKK